MRDIYNNPIKPGDKVRVMEGYGANAGMSRLYKDTIHTVASVHLQCKAVTGCEYGVKLESDPRMWKADRFLVYNIAEQPKPQAGEFYVAEIVVQNGVESFRRKASNAVQGAVGTTKFAYQADAEKAALNLANKHIDKKFGVVQINTRISSVPVYNTTIERP